MLKGLISNTVNNYLITKIEAVYIYTWGVWDLAAIILVCLRRLP